jgi:hypothetical protein
MRDIATRYADLAADVDGTGLMSPHDLRRAADRRARTRAGVLAAGVVAVTGTAAGGVALSDRPAPTPGPGWTPPATASPTAPPVPVPSPTPLASGPPVSSPAASSAPPPAQIPDRAFFPLPENLREHDTTRVPATAADALPPFCDDAFAEDATVSVRRSVYSIYRDPDASADSVPHGTVHQTVTGYRDGGAEAFMDRLRAAAADCATYRHDGTEVRFDVLDPPAAGDEAVLLGRTWPATEPEYTPGIAHVAVVRVGDVVSVLYVRGWETADSEIEYVNRFVEWAVGAIEAWR